MHKGIQTLLLAVLTALCWYLFKHAGFGYLAVALFLLFNAGLWVNKYRWLVLALDLAILVLVLFNFHIRKTTGIYLYEVIPDLYSIFLDTNTTEVKSTLINLSSGKELATIFTIALTIFIAFVLKPVQAKWLQFVLLMLSAASLIGLCMDKNFIVQKSISGVVTTTDVYQKNLEHLEDIKEFSWDAISTYNGPDTVVLVLGETTRGDRLGLNGYYRDTTPHLAQQHLINFHNVVSNATTTLISTPIIMTRSMGELNSKIFPEKSLIAAFGEAGYETFYISYIGPSNMGENSIDNMSSDADHYINTSEANKPDPTTPTDIIGLKSVQQALTAKAEKKLIVFKLIGSHFNFHDRYTEDFNVFRPSHLDVPFTGPKLEEQDILNNSYDNSLLVTDYTVSHIIDELKQLNGRTSLAFISDHGISIFDNPKSSYGGPTRHNYSIPLFFWFKPGYFNPHMVETLASNTEAKIDSTCFLDTFLTINNIATNKHKGCNLATSQIKPYPRMVIRKNKFVNFDKYFLKQAK